MLSAGAGGTLQRKWRGPSVLERGAGHDPEIIDAEGNLAWHPRTTLWGTLVDQVPGGTSCPLRFPGQYHDPETGLNYSYHRYYDPGAGRYESNDPLGSPPDPTCRPMYAIRRDGRILLVWSRVRAVRTLTQKRSPERRPNRSC